MDREGIHSLSEVINKRASLRQRFLSVLKDVVDDDCFTDEKLVQVLDGRLQLAYNGDDEKEELVRSVAQQYRDERDAEAEMWLLLHHEDATSAIHGREQTFYALFPTSRGLCHSFVVRDHANVESTIENFVRPRKGKRLHVIIYESDWSKDDIDRIIEGDRDIYGEYHITLYIFSYDNQGESRVISLRQVVLTKKKQVSTLHAVSVEGPTVSSREKTEADASSEAKAKGEARESAILSMTRLLRQRSDTVEDVLHAEAAQRRRGVWQYLKDLFWIWMEDG